jgi:RNA polymerase sigma factor (sigma-70 family)
MPTGTVPRRASVPRLGSKRLLALASDGRLVELMRGGSEPAFEIAFERHGAAILGFCRHMVGSAEEAEDAVQHTFAAAWRDLGRGDRRELALKPWLFAIARNRCLSMLRARREQRELPELATIGLFEEVERREEMRELLHDIGELPYQQREALLLSETGDLSHAEIAAVLGCEVPRVKSLVFRARSTLIARREARSAPCEGIREQLASLRGGALRRTELQLHLSECPGCRTYRDEVRRQRELLAAAMPVVPAGLKGSVLAAAGIGGGGAAAGGAAAGGAAVAGGVGATLGTAGSSMLAKLAVVGVLAGGGVVAGTTLVDELPGAAHRGPSAFEGQGIEGGAPGGSHRSGRRAPGVPAALPDALGRERGGRGAPERPDGAERSPASRGAQGVPSGSGTRARARGRKLGHAKKAARQELLPAGRAKLKARAKAHRPSARGRGPIEAPPPSVPVRRGPPEPKPAKKAPVVKSAPPAPEPAPVPKPKAPTKTKVSRAPSAVPAPPEAAPKKDAAKAVRKES